MGRDQGNSPRDGRRSIGDQPMTDIERLPTERAITAQVKDFKGMTLG
jgi:predicted TIM-barrel enzyme